MARYLSLIKYTTKGIENVQDSVKRAGDFRALVEDAGGKVLFQYWALGDRDGAVVFEVEDEQTGASLLIQLAQQGYVRTETLRVFDESEFSAILGQ